MIDLTPYNQDRIDDLHERLRAVHGDSYHGGIVLSDLGDAWYDAGSFGSALGRYQAAEGHLERTSQFRRLYHVRGRIDEIENLDEKHRSQPSDNLLNAIEEINSDLDQIQKGKVDRLDRLILHVPHLTTEIIKWLKLNPNDLGSIPPEIFEELIAELLAHENYEVQLNVRLSGQSKGSEADILAFLENRVGKTHFGYIVECKRWKKERKVQISFADRLYGLKSRFAQEYGIDRAMLVTTAYVTHDVKHQYGNRWDFDIKEYDQVVEWLKQYKPNENGLYMRR